MAAQVDSDQSSSRVLPGEDDGRRNREWKLFSKLKRGWKSLELDMPTLLLMMKYVLCLSTAELVLIGFAGVPLHQQFV